MSCTNCPPADYILRERIQTWLRSGYDANKVAAILGCSLDLIADVQANGIGEYIPVEPTVIFTPQNMYNEEETEEETEEDE